MADDSSIKPVKWAEWKAKNKGWSWPTSPEWASEWILYWSRTWEFVKVFELAGKFAFVAAAVTWLWEAGDRETARKEATKAKQYRAWELINSARGASGDGGRRLALEDLVGDSVSLAGAQLNKAVLANLNLYSADFINVNFHMADIRNSKMVRSKFYKNDFAGTILDTCDLTKSRFGFVDFNKNYIARTVFSKNNWYMIKLSSVSFYKVKLDYSVLNRVDFKNSTMTDVNFSLTRIENSSFHQSTCNNCNFMGAVFNHVSFYQSKIYDNGTLSTAKFCDTTMPDGTIRNEHCSEVSSENFWPEGVRLGSD